MSFVKRGSEAQTRLPGTRKYINKLTVTSSGLEALDQNLGVVVGIPLGSLLLVCGQDSPHRFSELVPLYFAAEAAANDHTCIVVGTERMAVPTPRSTGKQHSKPRQEHKMTIAWQYEKYVNAEKASSHTLCHHFDLVQRKQAQDQHVVSPGQTKTVLQQLKALAHANSSTVCRIVVPNFGSPLDGWSLSEMESISFMEQLKALAETLPNVCICLRVCSGFFSDTAMQVISYLSHASVSMSGLEAGHPFGDYDGVLEIKQLYRIDSVVPLQFPDTLFYLYKQSRREFVIEKMFLPPEDEGESESVVHNPKLEF